VTKNSKKIKGIDVFALNVAVNEYWLLSLCATNAIVYLFSNGYKSLPQLMLL